MVAKAKEKDSHVHCKNASMNFNVMRDLMKQSQHSKEFLISPTVIEESNTEESNTEESNTDSVVL